MFIVDKTFAKIVFGTTLLATFSLSAPIAYADPGADATLAHNERAAQRSIVGDRVAGETRRNTVSILPGDVTLAQSELAARNAIVSSQTGERLLTNSVGDATLVHNELAAQRVIADVPRIHKSPVLGTAVAKNASQQ